jgi:hypothetical protein
VSDERPIIGHIRFSFYGTTDTRLRPDEDGAALAQLYDETRMARRFYLFEKLTIPSLLAQTDQNFLLVVMSSDVMPEPYKERLREVMACFPDAIVDFSESRQGGEAFHPYMVASLGLETDGVAVHFRIDDDDALANTYIARLRRLSQKLRPGTHITFPTGILLFPTKRGVADGRSMIVKVFLTAAGLAIVSNRRFLKSPFQMSHHKVWEDWPVVSDPGLVAYIRTLHFNNDTLARQDRVLRTRRPEREGSEAEYHESSVEAALTRGFPFLDRVRLDALIGEVEAIRSMSDLPPVARAP